MRRDQLGKLSEAQTLLAELDGPGLLSGSPVVPLSGDDLDLDEDALLAELGISDTPADEDDITVPRHVRSSAEKRAAEEIADRLPCDDFDQFQPLIAEADKDPAYLLAEVEVVATDRRHNLNRSRLESLFHRLFGAAQLDLTIEDRFGNPVKPREWFLVPLHVIDEAVQRIRDGSITDAVYDPKTAQLLG